MCRWNAEQKIANVQKRAARDERTHAHERPIARIENARWAKGERKIIISRNTKVIALRSGGRGWCWRGQKARAHLLKLQTAAVFCSRPTITAQQCTTYYRWWLFLRVKTPKHGKSLVDSKTQIAFKSSTATAREPAVSRRSAPRQISLLFVLFSKFHPLKNNSNFKGRF